MPYEGAQEWMAEETYDSLRETALANVFFPGNQHNDLAAPGGVRLMVEGEGIKLRDYDGNWLYDVCSGLMLVNAGHGRQEIVDAIADQLSTLHFTSTFDNYTIPMIKLAEKLASIAPGDQNHAFFTSGGTESVESALKMARQYHTNRGDHQRTKHIARRGSYHGMSMATFSLTSPVWVDREPFEPQMKDNVFIVPHPLLYRDEFGSATQEECDIKCAEAVEQVMLKEGPETFSAVIAEPVSHSVGMGVPTPTYFLMLREICDRHGVLLIADEVITGYGRTGRMFGMEHFGVTPDITATAKGLTSGYFPMGAVMARDHIYDGFKGGLKEAFVHGFTYSGHPAAAAAGLANIEIIERESLVENSAAMGKYMLDSMMAFKEHPTVGDVRGLGLLCAVDLVADKTTKEPLALVHPTAEVIIRQKMYDLGVLARVVRGFVFSPPLIVTKDDVDQMLDAADKAIGHMEKELGLD